jgi:hypothetical protein
MRRLVPGLFILALMFGVVVAQDDTAVTAAGEDGAVQPSLAVDSEGKLYLAYGAGGKFWLRTSEDAKTWSEPVSVSEGMDAVMAGNTRGPRVAIADEVVVVTGFAKSGKDGFHLYCFRKDKRDDEFKAHRVTDAKAKDAEGLHDMCVDDDGTVHVTWMDARSKGAEPWYAYSTNEGKTFKGHTAAYSSPDGSICPCCAPGIAAADDTIVVQFRNKLRLPRDGQDYNDMYAAVSDNKGRKWEVNRLDDRERWKG